MYIKQAFGLSANLVGPATNLVSMLMNYIVDGIEFYKLFDFSFSLYEHASIKCRIPISEVCLNIHILVEYSWTSMNI